MTSRYGLLALLFILSQAVQYGDASEDWIFLKDGRVGLADRSQKPLNLTFPDGKREKIESGQFAAFRTQTHVNQAIDAIIKEIKRGIRVKAHTKRFQAFRAAAIPRLCHHLKTSDDLTKLIALFGLQYCWSPNAIQPVLNLLTKKDPEVRKAALAVLARHLKTEALYQHLKAYENSDNLELSAFVFALGPKDRPRPGLVGRLLSQPSCWCHVGSHLPRYQLPDLGEPTRSMLDSKKQIESVSALAALIHQNDNSFKTRLLMRKKLLAKDAVKREMAAEYLTWHGTATDIAPLTKALASERDTYAKASIRAALKSIKQRPHTLSNVVSLKQFKRASPLNQNELAIEFRSLQKELLAASPTPSRTLLKKAFGTYAWNLPVEPHWVYGKGKTDETYLNFLEARFDLQASLFGIPGNQLSEMPAALPNVAQATSLFMPPVRNYLNPKRTSYGFMIPETSRVFADSVHVGDDVTWNEPQRTVVAIADGVVKSVLCNESWGYKIIIEHLLPDGSRVCSLYAHLSPFVHVREHEVVTRGQKIGAIGRSQTWENGGYLSHLHFGLHNGSFLQDYDKDAIIQCTYGGEPAQAKVIQVEPEHVIARISGTQTDVRLPRESNWICGYVSTANFKSGNHSWQDPQVFIKNRLAP